MQNEELEQIKEENYQKDLKAIENKDFKKSWVKSSPFIFYLSIACFILMTWGGCYRLYTKRYEKPKVQVQESTKYTPVYK
ncbi:MAG: hypothetical protein ACK5NK_13655 [Niabella sp.]